jgi:hypothetical protein
VVRAGAPPVLAVCSRRRIDQSCGSARAYADRARAVGVDVQVLPEQLTHAEINGLLGMPSSYTTAVERFMGSLDPAIAQRLGEAR